MPWCNSSFGGASIGQTYRGDILIIGIDASNLLQGGGRTHLIELISAAEPQRYGVQQVVVWGCQTTLDALPERPWLVKRCLPVLASGVLSRALWQRYELPKAARTERIDLLFTPGGTIGTDFRPVVTMSRNMLPFEWRELRRYGASLTGLRLLILRYTQSQSFQMADGIIFLTRYAQNSITRVTGPLAGLTTIIPHGINQRFQQPPKPQKPISAYSNVQPYRLLYVSIINFYNGVRFS